MERPPAWYQAPSERESELRVTRRRLDLGEPCKHKLGYPRGGGCCSGGGGSGGGGSCCRRGGEGHAAAEGR